MKLDRKSSPQPIAPRQLAVDAAEMRRLLAGEHSEPHRILGAHPLVGADEPGVVVRAFHPDAVSVKCLPSHGPAAPMLSLGKGGLFAVLIPGATLPLTYELEFRFEDGSTWRRDDPYRFLPTLGDVDLHLFNEGTHLTLWERLGAHVREMNGVRGVAFAVWAPNAIGASVTGDFCGWDGRLLPMRQMGSSGVYELFVPGVAVGAQYKYELRTPGHNLRVKTDPYAQWMEGPPGNASRVFESAYQWGDSDWMESRPGFDHLSAPMNVYEVHLGSWARVPEESNRPLTYREIAPKLIAHAKRFGYTHIELMPVAEHPFAASWGYQVTGYYAPTCRYGTPDDFRFFVDACHRVGLGVIIDWVPAHFPKDDFALRRFDGTALYEHDDPRRGEHPDWGTLIFNFGRNEVRNFLTSNALFWLKEFHVDGLRVDAVASMLYLDYSRKAGEWLPNSFGGKENIEAIDFLRTTNAVIRRECPGCFTVAEESTSWSGVTRPVEQHGLGFTFKWNMGWMHDTLEYFSKEPIHRRYHHNDLTFSMLYEYTEHFVNALSHDEVVHGKSALLEKMPGDLWQKFANLRTLFAYQYTRPGKQLNFMGSEIAPYNEWYYDASLDWHLADEPFRVGLARYLEDLGKLYLEQPPLWRRDYHPEGFAWVDCRDCDNSVLVYRRHDGEHHLVVILNLTPVPRDHYRIGVPRGGRYERVLCSDDPKYGGSGYPTPHEVHTEACAWHGLEQSVSLSLPPLAALVLRPC